MNNPKFNTSLEYKFKAELLSLKCEPKADQNESESEYMNSS